MTATRLPQWESVWVGNNYVYTTRDPQGRIWRMRLTRIPGGECWALSCEGRPELSRGLARLGGNREFELAEEYILAQG